MPNNSLTPDQEEILDIQAAHNAMHPGTPSTTDAQQTATKIASTHKHTQH